MVLTDVTQADTSTNTCVPVYYNVPGGTWTVDRVTFYGISWGYDPVMIPAETYLTLKDHLVIAPITRHYLTYLFGPKYFAKARFNLEGLEIMSAPFIAGLAKKIDVDLSRTHTHKGRARRVTKAIKKRMGIC